MTGELVPLADRLAALQIVRLALALLAAGAVVTVGDTLGTPSSALVPLSVGFAAVTSAAEAFRRRTRRRALTFVWWLLLLDGAYLALVVAETGGSSSRLLFLVHLHVVAAALLGSFRSGLLISAWHALLLVAADRLAWLGSEAPSDSAALALVAASFLVVASGAVIAAHLNERALRRSRRDLSDLVELGRDLERCLAVDDVAAAAALHLRHRLGYQRAAVVVDGSSGWSGARDEGWGPVYLSCPSSDHGVDAALAAGTPTLVAAADAARGPVLSTVLPVAGNVVVVPLLGDHEVIGALVVDCGIERSELAPEQLAVLVQSAANVALSVRAARLVAEVETLAVSDPLTGLANRRIFDETLEREIARSHRSGGPLALVLLDVDLFKIVNDTLGHQMGDEVLRQVGVALRHAARQDSLVARYGGEEFVVLLPDTFPEGALLAAERLRRRVAEQVTAAPVTLSAGVALVPVHAATSRDLIAAADAALYRAKAEGRDRTVRANSVTIDAP